jgi:outer membrane protein, multidrug efflux system
MTNKIQAALCASISTVLCLTGCAPHKQIYQQPQMPTAPAWHSGLSQPPQRTPASAAVPASAPAATEVKWRDYYTDDKLRRVIGLALKNNRDLRVAVLNVEKAMTQYRLQRASQFPELDAGGSGDAYRVPSSMNQSGTGSYISETDKIGVQVSSWELDFFGRLKNLSRQQMELYLASDQGRISTQISMIASVASQYLTVGSDLENLRLAQATLESQKATYDLARQSRDRGVNSDLDVSESLSQVQAAQVDVVKYTRQLNVDENELEVLVGAPVPAEILPSGLLSDKALKDISAGVPSDVLLRRPDILEAEHNLKSSYANMAAARAAYFPTITLTTSAGITSGALADLFKGGPGTWEFAPKVSLPIFDAGTRNANYKIAKIERDTYVANYEKAIQTAFQEVSDALNGRERLLEQEEAQKAEVKTLNETYRLTDARYKVGIDSYLSVLVAQRSLYSGQQSLISIQLSRLSNLVTLYKVLAGGAQ